jgi:hypothetical protein
VRGGRVGKIGNAWVWARWDGSRDGSRSTSGLVLLVVISVRDWIRGTRGNISRRGSTSRHVVSNLKDFYFHRFTKQQMFGAP